MKKVTMPEFKLGQRVWVKHEECYGQISGFSVSGIDVILESDGMVVDCAPQQLVKEG